MKSKIIFIINSIKQVRCIRRVQEFQDAGYQTEVYAFDRTDDERKVQDIGAKIIGLIQNGSGYFKRMKMMRKAIRSINYERDQHNVIFYLFNFDVAMAFLSLHYFENPKYIYEVSDLSELTIQNSLVRQAIIKINKNMMMRALLNVFTSEGFKDFYTKIPAEKIVVIPNRISSSCPLPEQCQRTVAKSKIRIGFVGIVRFVTTLNFAKVIAESFPNIELHLYGIISKEDSDALRIESLSCSAKNIILHGAYESPKDLPYIYKNIDFVLSAYPPTPGVIYAEPNKLYEAIYFRCPIIVGNRTFLGKKVEKLNIGYVVDAMNADSIYQFLSTLDEKVYQEKVWGCKKIPQKECLNINDCLFSKIESLC